jgi:cathepsin A (carboxypeptidase C)
MDINKNFLMSTDVMHPTSELLIPLIEDGIRVLIYAGVQDLMCNCEWRIVVGFEFAKR